MRTSAVVVDTATATRLESLSAATSPRFKRIRDQRKLFGGPIHLGGHTHQCADGPTIYNDVVACTDGITTTVGF